jgi:hypothetical protein
MTGIPTYGQYTVIIGEHGYPFLRQCRKNWGKGEGGVENLALVDKILKLVIGKRL